MVRDRVRDFEKDLISSIQVAGGGYINFKVDYARLADLTLTSTQSLKENYGLITVESPLRIIVEHTSANPAHPLHIGTARNPVLGDSLARILKARGHDVSRHFYIDDSGRQIATVVYGYQMLGRPSPPQEVKTDHFIGRIYAITACLTELQTNKNRLDAFQRRGVIGGDVQRIEEELEDWKSVAKELHQRYPKLFKALEETILHEPEPNLRIEELMTQYEAAEEETKKLFREVTKKCIEGFRDTLEEIEIGFDVWDWESELVWDSSVSEVLKQLEKTVFTQRIDGALEFDTQKAIDEMSLTEILGISAEETLPPLTLTRSDGTSLYTTRDIAYSLKKFKWAEKVINVIGSEQKVSQLQLRTALCVLGLRWMAQNQVHFSVGLVDLPGYRMSGRRGRFITFDEVLEESKRRAFKEVTVRNPSLTEEEKLRISQQVGVGAVKYALLSVESKKRVTFVWDTALDFEQNSAPFIQYAHVRACNILQKSEETEWKHKGELLVNPLEERIVLRLSRFPDTFLETAETLRPRLVSEYANILAKEFNAFYSAIPVIRASPEELRSTLLCCVDSVRIVLGTSLSLLGIDAPSRM
jgi:arginyl-tRNA synthetase